MEKIEAKEVDNKNKFVDLGLPSAHCGQLVMLEHTVPEITAIILLGVRPSRKNTTVGEPISGAIKHGTN